MVCTCMLFATRLIRQHGAIERRRRPFAVMISNIEVVRVLAYTYAAIRLLAHLRMYSAVPSLFALRFSGDAPDYLLCSSLGLHIS
jgi:hypothetical protein